MIKISIYIWITIILAGSAAGFGAGNFYRKQQGELKVGTAENRAKNILQDAEKQAENKKREAILEAKEEAIKIKAEGDQNEKERRLELSRLERRAIQKEEQLDKRGAEYDAAAANLQKREAELTKEKEQLETLKKEATKKIEQIARMTASEAKEQLVAQMQNDAKLDVAKFIKEEYEKAQDEADTKAQEIITGAIQRCAADHVAEATISVVQLPTEEVKGRIIGREGRNIRTLEQLTGVDFIIDDTPEAVVISGFDPLRREIARLTLENLIKDGRIHPTRIEETYNASVKELDKIIKQEGDAAALACGIHNLHPELIKLIGRLKYRTSYGQNVLKHSIEVSQIAGLMATELGLDPVLAKRIGLLHDIGKAIDHEHEGTHSALGAEQAKKYREKDIVVNGIAAHHGDVTPSSIAAILIQAGDAISAARPGARRENIETYVKRLEDLERIAGGFKGVEKAFALQAGREIRIIVKPELVTDENITMIALDVAKQIESEMEYPGQIKVNVIREIRATEYAK
ncbi:ribonuclease Y [Treponema sp. R6D11]